MIIIQCHIIRKIYAFNSPSCLLRPNTQHLLKLCIVLNHHAQAIIIVDKLIKRNHRIYCVVHIGLRLQLNLYKQLVIVFKGLQKFMKYLVFLSSIASHIRMILSII